jgi:hypothetical protein
VEVGQKITEARRCNALTYTRLADDGLDIRFEIAPPGTPENFAPYLSGRARRAGPPPPSGQTPSQY